MTTRYKLGIDQIPVAVECASVGHPYVDADGDTQFYNTHFDTEEEAWKKGEAECLAAISLIGADIEQLQAALRRAHDQAGHAAVEWNRFSAARRRYLQQSREVAEE